MAITVLIFSMLFPAGEPARAEGPEQRSSPEYQVKAAYLYNFARFVAWPPDDRREIRVCVLGEDPFGTDLDALGSRTVRGLPIVLERPAERGRLTHCHLLFIATSASAELSSILDELSEVSVLTIGESDGFAAAGGMIGFIERDGRVKLEINLRAARVAYLEISSKLLEVSRVVEASPGGTHP